MLAGERDEERLRAGDRVSFGVMKMSWNWTAGEVTQHYEYTKCH